MSQQRRNPHVDLLYSEWHRAPSLARFLQSRRDAFEVAMIDVDALEICAYCYDPLALIETKHMGASRNYTAMRKLADWANLPSYLVEYEPCEGDVWESNDIARFRVHNQHWTEPHDFLPGEYAAWLLGLRSGHPCPRMGEGSN